jgi:SAM-dependent methyltransferase
MDPIIYTQMSAIEDSHWWFVSRRLILSRLISKLKLPPDAKILDAGSGTGGNIAMLSQHGKVFPMELNHTAREIALKLKNEAIEPGFLPNNIPFKDLKFDLIVLLDVLEHVEDDIASLLSLKSRLKESGWLLITVPAYPWLWSRHDESNHHKRRYILRGLRRVSKNAGLRVYYISYFNSILFPLIAGMRLLKNIFKFGSDSDLSMPSKFTNKILRLLFQSEYYLLDKYRLPFGVSIVMIAQKDI